MLNLLLAVLQPPPVASGSAAFHNLYHVSASGSVWVNGTYYPLIDPDIFDEWGNPVYYNYNGDGFFLFAYAKNGNEYSFKISSNYPDSGVNYFAWTGTAPHEVNSPNILSGGSAPFPTIQ